SAQQDGAPFAGGGGARERAGPLQEAAEVLDDDFLLHEELVHHDRERLAAGPQRDDRQRPGAAGARNAQQATETHEVDRLAVDLDRLGPVEGPDLVQTGLERRLDRRHRYGEHLRAYPDHERVGDGDRQRQPDSEARTPARLGLHLDLATEAADLGAPAAHADSAPAGTHT